jgi:hypothetical protein
LVKPGLANLPKVTVFSFSVLHWHNRDTYFQLHKVLASTLRQDTDFVPSSCPSNQIDQDIRRKIALHEIADV